MSQKPTPGRPVSRTQAARSGPPVPVFALAVIGLVVVLVVAGLVVVVRGNGDDGERAGGEGTSAAAGDQAFGPVTVEGDALPPFAKGGDDPAVGTAAPTLVGQSPSGQPITIDPADGPMVVAFVAHWCPHCQAEVPRIVDLVDDRGELDGVKLVAVATGSRPTGPEYPPGDWLADEGWPAPVLVDSEAAGTEQPTAAAAYGLSGYPYLVAVDAEGDVVVRTSGEQGEDGLRDVFAAARGDSGAR